MNENNETKKNENIENQQVQDKNKKVQKNGKCKKVIAGIACIVVIGGVGFFVGVNSSKIFTKQSNDAQTSSGNSNNTTDMEQSKNDKTEQNKQDNNKESNNTNNQDDKKQTYTQTELEQMASDFYEEKTRYRPGSVASEVQKDGTIAIQLYDNFGSHNSTSDWYTINPKTAQGTDILGNQIDLKNKTFTIAKDGVSVKYTPEVEKKLTKGKGNYIYKNWIPEISGLNETVASSIENQIKKIYDKTYKETSADAEDDYIMEILEGYSEAEKSNNIGFDVICELEYVNNKIITFKQNFTGGLGGVGWDATSGCSFDIKTGKLITLGDVITDGAKYTQIAKNSVMNQLKADERYTALNEEYEKVVDSLVEFKENDEVYLREDGLVLIIPKYAIGPGAAGEFEFVITYDELKDCIDLQKML